MKKKLCKKKLLLFKMSFFFFPTPLTTTKSLGPRSLSSFNMPFVSIPQPETFEPEELPESLPDEPKINHQMPEDTRKILVLDLDETLIHTSSFPPHKDVKSLTFEFQDKKEYVFLRPDVEEFLNKATEMFQVFIFTAGTKGYADPILDELCPQIDQLHRFYRDSCKFSSKKVKKDLRKFGKSLAQVIMIDDNRHMKETYPGNTIYIDRWNGTPADDTLMTSIMPILVECSKVDDVRPIIKRYKRKLLPSSERFNLEK